MTGTETEVWLIRHGLPEISLDENGQKLMYGQEAPLSAEGIAQVTSLAPKISKLKVIYTSPFARARQTAELIAKEQRGVPVVQEPTLADVYYHNSLGMLLKDVVDEKVPPHPDDETWEQFCVRVQGGFKRIAVAERGNSVGLVSHGHVSRLLILRYVEGNLENPPEITPYISYNYLQQAEA